MAQEIKKIIPCLLTAMLIFSLISAVPPMTVQAVVGDTFTDAGSGLTFEVLSENSNSGNVHVIKDSYGGAAYTIPETVSNGVKNYTVIGIGYEAFKNSSLSAIVIPESVTYIGNYAFEGCSGLTSVDIPDGVTIVGISAFAGTGLTSVTIPENVTEIADWAFSGCSNLNSVTFLGANPPATIRTNVFSGCSAMTVTVPAGTLGYYVTALSGRLPAGSTLKSATAAITGVTVSPSAVEVVKGDSMTFTAIVNGSGSFGQAVRWGVDSSYGSDIDSTSGILTVAAGEQASFLTVTAISLADEDVFGEATVTVKPGTSSEEFSLPAGGTYYFDLSSTAVNVPTAVTNSALSDTSLKWVPFTYAGTVDAYSLTGSNPGEVNTGRRSLFVADRNLYLSISWTNLNDAGLIYGNDYNSKGISYLIRSLSVGNDYFLAQIIPENSEWDKVLMKGSYIKNYNEYFSWGQDTYASNSTRNILRGYDYAAYWMSAPTANYKNNSRNVLYGYRPALEILNAESLSSDALKTVTYEMGANGTLGAGSLASAAVVYTGELTLPDITAANGFNYTGVPQAGKILGWNNASVFYPAGTKLSSLPSGTVLTAGYGVPTYNGGSGGGNGSGGGGGVTKEESKIKITLTDKSCTATATMTAATDSSGKATAAVTQSLMNEAVDKAKVEAEKQGNGTSVVVEVAVEATTGTNRVETGIPKEAIGLAANGGADELKISTPVASISFDSDALAGINKEASADVRITTAKVDASTLTDDAKELVGDRPIFNFSVTSGNDSISEFGGNVTVSVPYTPKPGEDTNAIVIYYINSEGKPETVANCKYDPTTKTVIFTTNHFSQYAVGYNKVSFSDVKAGAWYENAVNFAAARGIVAGTGNGNYSPDGKLTRAQLLVMLMRAYGIEPDTELSNNFSDAGNAYYTGYLAAAKRLGITEGLGNNLYAPNSDITRQEMFTLLYNTLKVIGQLPEGTGKTGGALTGYSDADSVASWAKDAAGKLTDAGIVSGSNGKLSPKNTTTRAEMAQVLYNLLLK